MRQLRFFISLALLGCLASSQLAAEPATAEPGADKAQAVALVKQFAGQLQPELKQALTSGGPVHAVQVCSKEAPRIAERLSADSGWQVKRVSLKARNAKTAQPDAWETSVLEQFDRRIARGESPDKLVYWEQVNKEFRFMKGIPVKPLCLTCHGEVIAPQIRDALDSHYPEDRARGYTLGQIRGAFSLTKPAVMKTEQ